MSKPPPSEGGTGRNRLVDVGRYAWAVLGIVGVLVVAYLVLSRLAVVVVPLVLAFFIAGALEPVTRWLNRLRLLPRALAALLSLLVAVALISGVIALVVPAFQAQVPVLVRSVQQAIGQLERLLGPDVDMQSAASSIAMGVFGGGGNSGLVGALDVTVSVATGFVLAVVVAFFYLAEGRWLVSGMIGWLPRGARGPVREVAERLWETTGQYVRGILLVALIDAIGIGLGVYLLGVSLALPIAVLVYLGALVPVVGAFVTGLLAVLIAFADGGWWLALGALLVVVVVQQIEGNVLQPVVMGKVIRLPAFVILVAVAIGFAWLGVVGAFLAVPVAASVARVIEYVTDEQLAQSPSGAGSA